MRLRRVEDRGFGQKVLQDCNGMPPCLYVAVILGNEKYCEPLSLKRILNTFVLSISKILSGLLIQAQSRKYGVIGEE